MRRGRYGLPGRAAVNTFSVEAKPDMATATIKLYASLGSYLPNGAQKNTAQVTLPGEATIASTLERLNVPRERCHLVLVNGEFVPPSARANHVIRDGDTLAVWPPVAGG